MHISHQRHLVTCIAGCAGTLAEQLRGQHEEGDNAHPDIAAARKRLILENIDGLKSYTAELEPVLREQNQ